MRRLAFFVALGVWMVPTAASAGGPSPDPAALEKMLVGAPDPGWIESVPAPNTLEGPFDAQSYAEDVYDDAQTRADVASHLDSYGFLGGYGRTFYKAPKKAWIEEDVKSFDTKAGAISFWTWMKSWLPEGADTTTPVIDSTAIPNSFGTEWLLSGFHATDTLFTKGAFMYDVVMGSYNDFTRSDALAQARSAYEYAPAGDAPVLQQNPTPVGASVPPPSNGLAVAALTFVFLALGACLIGGLIAAIILVRRRAAPPTRTVLSPDGNYWWDGTTWQPVPRA